MKRRIREMAGELIKIAAAARHAQAPVLTPPEGLYDEFAARFPYEETEDQDRPSTPCSTTSPPAGRWTG